jgi:hypothetical protein
MRSANGKAFTLFDLATRRSSLPRTPNNLRIRKEREMRLNLLIILIIAMFADPSLADENAKVVFISGSPSHGPMQHEHRAGNMILADALNKSGLNVEGILVPHYGYPKDTSILKDADTIVIFCTGHKGHVLNAHLEEFDALMKKGVGVVMIH